MMRLPGRRATNPKDVKSEDIEKTVSILSELIWQVNRRLENDNSSKEYDELTETSKLPPPKAVALELCAWKARASFSC